MIKKSERRTPGPKWIGSSHHYIHTTTQAERSPSRQTESITEPAIAGVIEIADRGKHGTEHLESLDGKSYRQDAGGAVGFL